MRGLRGGPKLENIVKATGEYGLDATARSGETDELRDGCRDLLVIKYRDGRFVRLVETIFEQFMFELLSTPRYIQWNIHAHYSKHTGEWNVEGKPNDRINLKANNTYGTGRINASTTFL